MAEGTPIARQWVVTLMDGTMVIDWGDGTALDIDSGEFIDLDHTTLSYPVNDTDLDTMVRSGKVAGYDKLMVYFFNLPDKPLRSLS
jgi:hypothetical protein